MRLCFFARVSAFRLHFQPAIQIVPGTEFGPPVFVFFLPFFFALSEAIRAIKTVESIYFHKNR